MKIKFDSSISVLLAMGFLFFNNSIEILAAPTTTTIGTILKMEESHLLEGSANALQNQDKDVKELESLKHESAGASAAVPDLEEQLEALSKASDAEQTHTHHHGQHPTAHHTKEHIAAHHSEVTSPPPLASDAEQVHHPHAHHPVNVPHQVKEHSLEELPADSESSDEVVEATTHPVTAHPPHLPHPDVPKNSEKEEAKPPIKTFPGAARLTYGTHLESDVNNAETTVAPPTAEEVAEDAETTEMGSMPQKRSHNELLQKPIKYDNAETLLRHSGGQYSAFDMAQYVFWTGDEAGVANAIEEFIQEGLMSREAAIKFLRDIRLGIEYLQSTYSHNTQGMSDEPASLKHHKSIPTIAPAKPTLSPEVVRALEKLPSLLKLHENSERKGEDNALDYDEMAGRLRLADFLYAEYSLEEVIYQLAKVIELNLFCNVMFTQSLTRGSEQAQTALQRLTGFLESEGAHGRISPALQKKVLDVLLAALSDTLSENPELLTAARMALGGSLNKIPSKI